MYFVLKSHLLFSCVLLNWNIQHTCPHHALLFLHVISVVLSAQNFCWCWETAGRRCTPWSPGESPSVDLTWPTTETVCQNGTVQWMRCCLSVWLWAGRGAWRYATRIWCYSHVLPWTAYCDSWTHLGTKGCFTTRTPLGNQEECHCPSEATWQTRAWCVDILFHVIPQCSAWFWRTERSTDQVIKPVNLEALTRWVGHIPADVQEDMENIAPMLRRLGYNPNANPPDYGQPEPEVVNNTQRVLTHIWTACHTSFVFKCRRLWCLLYVSFAAFKRRL